MATIGKFHSTEKGYEGRITTLTMDCEVQLVSNKDPKHENSPDFFVKSDDCDLGFARYTVAKGEDGLPYVSVYLDDPSFASPIWAALFNCDDGAELVWSRSFGKAG